MLCSSRKPSASRVRTIYKSFLKPGGQFRLLEMVYSKTPHIRKRQDLFTPFVEKVYGARFDRKTLDHVINSERLRVLKTNYLKHDVYLLIDGIKDK